MTPQVPWPIGGTQVCRVCRETKGRCLCARPGDLPWKKR